MAVAFIGVYLLGLHIENVSKLDEVILALNIQPLYEYTFYLFTPTTFIARFGRLEFACEVNSTFTSFKNSTIQT